GVALDELAVSNQEFDDCEQFISFELKQAINLAKGTITAFHAAQDQPLPVVKTADGVTCWQKSLPIERVGLYIPGGTAPLFSTVLMLAIPAKLAGCEEIILCTPPGKDGKVHPAVLYAAKVAGVRQVFKVGGAQAIAAMAYGTETIPKVYKIYGPGNQYVTAAKQWVSLHEVAIDMPAGPSEVEVLADESANPVFVASDLLSQAEHGADSQAILITTAADLADKVAIEVERQLATLPRKEVAIKALENSRLIVVESLEVAIWATNAYAPEHLILAVEKPEELAERITNAGSIFLGHLTPESAGDYASGTNHTLPTNGYAKAYSGVNLDSFRKRITYQSITPEGLRTIGPAIETMAEAESLDAHKQAVTLRLNSLK
ncbi:MAG: histidinol dehydrogenase, partial [Bacteroidales bacterium]|nr:histidinol dehydrogenase [Bacteroidales bacterium]